jgi:ribosomal protein S18 acetylase RimI-like enzyme
MAVEHIRFLEELALNAWPALQVTLYDGWLLRFAGGYTRRANSVSPIYPSSLGLGEKTTFCERSYAARRLPAVFKITPAVQPPDLDAALAQTGYARDGETSVQVASLAMVPSATVDSVAMETRPTPEWLSDFCRLRGVDSRLLPTMAGMLEAIVPAHCFMTIRGDGETLAMGLAVLERGYVSLHDIVTAPTARNRGLGSQLVAALLEWGRAGGARKATLAVMCDNAPALHLYAKLGFVETYRYWYRVKASSPSRET